MDSIGRRFFSSYAVSVYPGNGLPEGLWFVQVLFGRVETDSFGFLLATVPQMSWLFSVPQIVEACTCVPDVSREVCNSLEVMCGLALSDFSLPVVLLGDHFNRLQLLGRGAVMLKVLHFKSIVLQWMDGAGIFWR